eukprot:37776_1
MTKLLLVISLFSFTCGNNITCPSNEACRIICEEWDPINGCSESIIDASDSLSLEVVCSSQNKHYGGCQFTDIYCPEISNSSCNIACNDYFSCYLTDIYSSNITNNINIKCASEHGSCTQATLYADNARNIDISCHDSDSLLHSPCNSFRIYGRNVLKNVSLRCDGDYSCSNIDLHVNNANHIDIFARGLYSLSGYIYAENANQFSLFCASEESEFGCYDTYIFNPPYIRLGTPRALLQCHGHGCKDKLYFFSENGALDWKISLNGCNECD